MSLFGVDLGGTKIEGRAFDAQSKEIDRFRIPTPREDYHGTVQAIVDVVRSLETRVGDARVTAARVPPETLVSAGDQVRLSVQPGRLHFFDPESENVIA